jgi:hypothetical protein
MTEQTEGAEGMVPGQVILWASDGSVRSLFNEEARDWLAAREAAAEARGAQAVARAIFAGKPDHAFDARYRDGYAAAARAAAAAAGGGVCPHGHGSLDTCGICSGVDG